MRWPRRVKTATVENYQGRGRSKFGWLDGVKRALAVREVGLEAQLSRNGECGEKL